MNHKSILARTVALGLSLLAILTLILYFTFVDEASEDLETPATLVSWSMKGTHSIKNLEARLMKSPADLTSRISLAQAYLQEAQASLQEAYFLPKVQAQIDKALALEENNYEALALQASLYNTLHQFEKARDLATSLIARADGKAYVYGILVDALVELGQYDAAVAACDEMIRLRPGISSYSRAAYLRELHGDTQGAIEAMKLAAEAGIAGETDRSWALYQLGQLYLGNNDIETAAFIFDGILDETPYYAYAIGGKGQVALQQRELAKAIALFEEAHSFVPADEFIEGLIEAYTLGGDLSKVPEYTRQLKASYINAESFGENVRMEYADFLADHDMDLKEALHLAKLEYQRRPNHLHALETYAWALHKNGQSEDAIPYIEQAMRLETGDAMVHYRAGHIYKEAGQVDRANDFFEAALAANLHIESPVAAAEVR